MSETAVFLHGFAGAPSHWNRVLALIDRERYTPLVIGIAQATPVTLTGVLEHIAARAPSRFVLCGYSMGGRLALAAALALPERVTRLVLVATSAGIADPSERDARRLADRALAAQIELESIEAFIERWREVALFAGDPAWVTRAVAEEERNCTPAQLAASLRGLGSGELEPVWHRLGELMMPVTILAGARDERYCEIAGRLGQAIAHAHVEIVPDAGHRVALEAPGVVAAALG